MTAPNAGSYCRSRAARHAVPVLRHDIAEDIRNSGIGFASGRIGRRSLRKLWLIVGNSIRATAAAPTGRHNSPAAPRRRTAPGQAEASSDNVMQLIRNIGHMTAETKRANEQAAAPDAGGCVEKGGTP